MQVEDDGIWCQQDTLPHQANGAGTALLQTSVARPATAGSPTVDMVLSFSGIDPPVCACPSLEAAAAAGVPTAAPAAVTVVPGTGDRAPPGGNGAAATAGLEHRLAELLDTIISSLFVAGLSLHAALDLHAEAARGRIIAVLGDLDDTICVIRRAALTTAGTVYRPDPGRATTPGDDSHG